MRRDRSRDIQAPAKPAADCLLPGSADGEVGEAAEGAEDREGHRHHEEDAVVVAGRDGFALRIVLSEAFFARRAGGGDARDHEDQREDQCENAQRTMAGS